MKTKTHGNLLKGWLKNSYLFQELHPTCTFMLFAKLTKKEDFALCLPTSL